MALEDNLVSYWTLDETSGNRSDSVGSNTLSSVNSSAGVAGRIGNALRIIQGDQNTLTRSGRVHSGNGAFSFSFWVKGTFDGNTYWQPLAQRDVNFELDYAVIIVDGRINWTTYAAGTINYNGLPAADVWTHIVVTAGPAGHKLYVNGTLEASSGSAYGPAANDPDTFWLGSYRPDHATVGTAYVDEVGYWTKILSDAEVTQLYNGGAGITYPFPTPPTSVSVTPGPASLTITTFAPSVSVGTVVTPGPATLTITTFAPTVTVGSGSNPSKLLMMGVG